MKLKRSTLYPLSIATCIFLASGSQNLSLPQALLFPYFDKFAHFLIYGLFATSLVRLPLSSQPIKNWLLSLILASLYGLLDEYRQSFTPGRFVESADWIANSLGACVAVLSYTYCRWYHTVLECPLAIRCIKKGFQSLLQNTIRQILR